MRPAALNLIGALTLLSNLMAGPATAWDRQVKQGETLARTNCARCHAVGARRRKSTARGAALP
jgi:cytochrome c